MRIRVHILKKRIPVSRELTARTARSVLRREGVAAGGNITICFVSDTMIQDLNRRFHGRNRPTDVLAFELHGRRQKLHADVYISVDTAVANAKSFKTTPVCEAMRYVIHAMLHLCGYRDRTPKQRVLMEKKEESYLKCQ